MANFGDSKQRERNAESAPIQRLESRGYINEQLSEPVPQLIRTSSEKVIEGSNNAQIVLGRDRPASRLSGYGGLGNPRAGSIDIVVGRMANQSSSFTKRGSKVWVDPSFEKDAARIYISQKTDIDDNFNLTEGNVGNPLAKSGIGLKADGIRLVAREGIKLITKVDSDNSQGSSNVLNVVGVDLIAANDDSDLQPLVKGINTRDAIKRLAFHVDKLNGIVDSLLMTQMLFNTALTHHFHFSPFFGLATTPSPPVVAAGVKAMIDHLMQTKTSLMMNKTNLVMFKFKYLNPAGPKYINSRFHNCN